ncbi:type VI secretion system amidase effector protein Tae4 [Massilia rhizosphaerae]|uniref:type VI secretion system amidase effector protein Tae4 n=1 Tax=Massilia rhizosphaerae TaxID=2784389 RepID=UPI0018DD5330|nr:type VI secretion system amidase effector protein Tae4 [Massilia rhizosphaerae]
MTKTLVQHARVRTNTIKDSVCKIDVPVVKFSDLWENYVTGAPFKPAPDDKADYSNQCALRMSATFHKVGIKMLSFSQKTVKPMPGAQALGRVIMDGFPAAVRAYELGEWLKLQPFCGLPKQPENITGKDWESKINGRTGIIMFHAYWARDTDSTGQASGGHIDLWNGKRLTIASAEDFIAVAGRWIGVQSAHIPGTSLGYSDLRNAKLILFWEVK